MIDGGRETENDKQSLCRRCAGDQRMRVSMIAWKDTRVAKEAAGGGVVCQ